MKSFIGALLFALVAAIGNAAFVYGTKKSVPDSNPFVFTIFALIGCIVLMGFSFFFFDSGNIKSWLLQNRYSLSITSVGLFFTYLGFYLLYSNFGASYYILYAVMSIVTTSIIVAVVFFHEKFNWYFGLSILFAFLTILFFYLGKSAE